MKKLIALSTLFAVSGVAMAAFQSSETSEQTASANQALEQVQQAAEQAAAPKADENQAKPEMNPEAKPEMKPEGAMLPPPPAGAKPEMGKKDGKAPFEPKFGKRDGNFDKAFGKQPQFHGKMAQGAMPAGHPAIMMMPMMHNMPQGFIDLDSVLKDSKSALEGKDRSIVMLEGNITKQVNDDEYTFVDNTGSIKLEIHRGAWKGKMITPKDKVRIEGVLDKQWEVPEVKVKRVQKIN